MPPAHTSRITIVTSGTPQVIEQIEAQLRRLGAGASRHQLDGGGGRHRARNGAGQTRARGGGVKAGEKFQARLLDRTEAGLVFEITDAPARIDAFIEALRPLGLVDVSRTGVAAIARGPETT